jgi:cytochrome c oxidase subunit 1
VLIFIGFNVTFFPQFLAGLQGMPRRYFNLPEQFLGLNQLSTVGSWIMGAGLFLVGGYLLASLFRGKRAPSNPWGAVTLEWTHTNRMPLPHNFERTPIVTRGPYDFHLAKEIFQGPEAGDGHGTAEVPEVEEGRAAEA